MTCGRVKWGPGVLTVAEAERIFGRHAITEDIPYEAGEGFICGRFSPKELCSCGVWAEYLCDYPLGNGKTCDAPLCADHAMLVNNQAAEMMRPHDLAVRRDPQLALRFEDHKAVLDDLHYCPAHFAEAARRI